YVVLNQTGPLEENRPVGIGDGQSLIALASEGNLFAQNWLNRLSQDQGSCNLETLPPAERFRQRQGQFNVGSFRSVAAAAGLGTIAAEPPMCREFRAGLENFRKGAVLIARSPTFWCPERSKVDFVDEVKLLFHSSDGLPPNVTLAKTSFPLWELQDD